MREPPILLTDDIVSHPASGRAGTLPVAHPRPGCASAAETQARALMATGSCAANRRASDAPSPSQTPITGVTGLTSVLSCLVLVA